MIIALCGAAGAGKDTVGDTLVQKYGFRKESFAAPLKQAAMKLFGLSYEQCNDALEKERPLKTDHHMPFNDTASLLAHVDEVTQELFDITTMDTHSTINCSGTDKCAHEVLSQARSNIMIHIMPYLCQWTYGARVNVLYIPTPRKLLQLLGTEVYRAIDADVWVNAWASRAGNGHVVATDCRFDNEAAIVKDMGGVLWRVDRPSNMSRISGHASERGYLEFQVDKVFVNDGSIDQLHSRVWSAVDALGTGPAPHALA